MLGRVTPFLYRRTPNMVARRAGSGESSLQKMYQPANTIYHPNHRASDMLPFNTKQNRWVLLVKLAVYASSGFSIPFFAMWWNLKTKYGKKQ